MTNTTKRRTISDDINALIRTKTIATPVERPAQTDDGTWTTVIENHVVTHESLLDQLGDTVTASPLTNADAYSGNAGSKPPSRLDAIALLHRIKKESRAIADTIRLRRTRDLVDRLSAIAGATPDLSEDDRAWIQKRTRSWVITARIVTGWDAAPYAPDVPCPNIDCERRASLRIRLDDRVGSCIECGEVWDTDRVEQLGHYVNWASEHLRGAKHWLTDEEGELVDCVECLDTREQMAERKNARRHAEPAPAA